MPSVRPGYPSRRVGQVFLVVLLFGLVILTSGCGGDAHLQQQANQNKTQLDSLLAHAQSIGVPSSLLQPIMKQEQQLSSTGAPFSPFNDAPVNAYYQNLARHYQQLTDQVQNAIASSTSQFQQQAQHDMENFGLALSRQRAKGVGNIAVFNAQFNKDQTLMSLAQTPKQYAAVSQDADTQTAALDQLSATYAQLVTFKSTISQMQKAQLDTSAMQTQYKSDLQTLNAATVSPTIEYLNTLINAQYQEAVVNSFQALPYVTAAKLNEFQAQISLLKTYGMDTSAYQARLKTDTALMQKAKNLQDYLTFSQQIDADIASMHDDLVQGEANYLIGAIDRQARAWGAAHAYHDKFDGNNYDLAAGYTTDGIGYWIQRDLSWAYTPDDFQAVVDEENNELFSLQMMEQDYADKTPYNQVHQTDLELIQHYGLQHSQVLVISFVEQALRVYQNGKLVKAFLVTTGRQELPSLPGDWTVQNRQSPTVFKSDDPPGSPYWYPDTPINYAILYHWGGYFVHDAWWRVNFGPGTQFPHYDVGGDESFAGNGSHGCVNMQEQQAAWVYDNTNWNTQIVIY
ncbi:MAG TPA: L,D-transpeptidase [Ktedonobacteraceae bacterium]|nr:L,D-transpeptidase [Ktedonobacteraceae bacterium]